MVVVYDPFELDYVSLGLAVLHPSSCVVAEEAGGDYALKLVHPLSASGEWAYIQPFTQLKVPVPLCVTPFVSAEDSTILTVGVEVWQANGSCYLYSATSAALWPAWQSGRHYSVGDKVSHGGTNYKCTTSHGGVSTWNPNFWSSVSMDPPKKKSLTAGTQIYVTEKKGNWLTAVMMDGTKGYCRLSEFTYLYTLDEEAVIDHDIESRQITEQVFRVTDVTINSAQGTLTANAKHISYDYAMQLVGALTLADTPLAESVAALRAAFLPDGVSSAPNIYCQNTGAVISGAYTRKTLSNCLLDPDSGLVAQGKAMLIRDNREFFLLKNTAPNRGFSLTYGVNLKGVTWKRDFSRLVTRVIPIAKASNGDEYLLPDPYVDSDDLPKYPIIMYKALTVDAQIGKDGATEQSVQDKMVAEAEKVFTEDKEDQPLTTLNVDFVMLGDTEEYARYKALERLSLYDTVEIFHPDLGLSTAVQVKGYEWDALAERYTKITLGDVFDRARHTVTGYDLSDGCISYRKFSGEVIAALKNDLA